MDKLTLEICKQFTSNPEINPLTGRKIKINGPLYLTIQEKCKELQQIEDLKHTIKTPTKINIANFKHVILYELDTLRKDELNNKNIFKARAYSKVINGIELIDYPIQTWDDIKHVEGIGAKIETKIKEILRDGMLFKAQEIRKNPKNEILNLFSNIHGIGIVKAKELYKLGITSIEELKQNQSSLNATQILGLKYYEDFNIRIPREEMNMHYDYLNKIISNKFKFEIVGSYRRGADSSGDIDVILHGCSVTEFNSFINYLYDEKYLIDHLSHGNIKYLGVCKLPHKKPRRIDILLTTKEEFPFAILYFTGSKNFNIKVRRQALELGFSLNEFGLTSLENKVVPSLKTEKQILEFIIGEYVIPEKRN